MMTPADEAAIRAGIRPVLQRIQNAHDWFLDLASTRGLTLEQGASALRCLVRHRLAKLDANGGRYTFTHGAALERDVLLRAAENCPPVGRRKRQR